MDAVGTILLIALAVLFGTEMYHSLKRSNTTARLVREYGRDLDNPKLLEEIYAYCTTDYKLKRIMAKYGATKEDLRALQKKLTLWGNFQKGRRLVPINSFFYAYALDWLLSHKDGDPKEMAIRMMNFFHI